MYKQYITHIFKDYRIRLQYDKVVKPVLISCPVANDSSVVDGIFLLLLAGASANHNCQDLLQ